MTNTRSPSTVTAIRPRWVLGLISIAYFMVVLDSLVAVTALGWRRQDLHADLAATQCTHGHLGNHAAVTTGFRPALWSTVAFAVLAAATALAIPAPAHLTPPPQATAHTNPADVLVAA
jgi:hypothetical protein